MRFKTVGTIALLCISSFSLVLYTACKKNTCGNTTCQNGGVCQADTCVCPTGYLGNDCSTSWATQFLGSYTCTQSCTPALNSGTWTSVITANSVSGQDTVVISDFGGNNFSATAGVDGSGNIYILSSNNAGTTGSGSLVNGVLTIKYSTLIGGGSGGYVCTVTMKKQ
jgi:hypothetical protein